MLKVFQIYTVYNSHVWDTVITLEPLNEDKELLFAYIKNSSKWNKEWGDPVNFYAWEVVDAEIEPYTKVIANKDCLTFQWEMGLRVYFPTSGNIEECLIECGCEELHYHKAAEAAAESFNRWYKEFRDQW